MDATRRHWWLVVVGMLAGVAGAGAVWATATRHYESSTSVLVTSVGVPIDLGTEAQLARSTGNATGVATRLRSARPPEQLAASLRVDVLANTSVLVFRYQDRTPAAAQSGSQAFAETYLANRVAAARRDLGAQLAVIEARMTEHNGQLAATNDQIARLPDASPQLASLNGVRATLTRQIDELATRANTLSTTTVSPGSVIRDATLPASPVSPVLPAHLAIGAAGGLLLGVMAAVVRSRFDRRVRHGSDMLRAGVPLLAELRGQSGVWPDDGVATHGPNGRPFNRLRNEIVASLADGEQVIVVTGVSPGLGATVVAANLAAALARAGHGVVLVGANVPEIGAEVIPLSRLFDVADIPGLTDVLAHRASLFRALQRAPLLPGLRVVTPGGAASASGLLQTPGVRTALLALRHRTSYIVVEAPSAASGADAQSLARVADVAVLVVQAGTALASQLVDAAEQVRRVGTRLLGAVLLPRHITVPQDGTAFGSRPRGQREPSDFDMWNSTVDDAGTVDPPTSAFKQLDPAGLEPRRHAAD
jgi:Mrp family chromosome partitioning ATPase